MREIIVCYLPWFMSFFTIAAWYLTGNKVAAGWVVALFSELLWTIWILASGTFGLIPANIVLIIVCIRNFIKWHQESLV
jgi:hypothetical protein